jgi:protein TonB
MTKVSAPVRLHSIQSSVNIVYFFLCADATWVIFVMVLFSLSRYQSIIRLSTARVASCPANKIRGGFSQWLTGAIAFIMSGGVHGLVALVLLVVPPGSSQLAANAYGASLFEIEILRPPPLLGKSRASSSAQEQLSRGVMSKVVPVPAKKERKPADNAPKRAHIPEKQDPVQSLAIGAPAERAKPVSVSETDQTSGISIASNAIGTGGLSSGNAARGATLSNGSAAGPGGAGAKNGRGTAASKADWLRIHEEIRRHLAYPVVARRKGWTGRVLLYFRIRRDGNVANTEIKNSSGYASLDEGALRALHRAAPFEKRPAPVDVIMPVVFALR